MNYIKHTWSQFLSKKGLLLLVVYLFFTIQAYQSSVASDTNLFDFILKVFGYQYYTIYFAVPLFLYLIADLIMEHDELYFIRIKNYKNYYYTKLVSFFVIATTYVVLHLIIPLIIGFGFSLNNEFTDFKKVDELYLLMSHHFNTPLEALIYSALWMIIGLTTIAVIIQFIYHFFGARTTLVAFGMLFVSLVVGIRTDQYFYLGLLLFNNYILLHNAIISFGNYIWIVLLFEAIIIFTMGYLIGKYWYKKGTIRLLSVQLNRTNQWYLRKILNRKNAIIVSIVLVLLTFSIYIRYQALTYQDLTLIQWYGIKIGQFQWMDLLYLLLFNGLPLFLLFLYLENELRSENLFVTIRLKSKSQWINKMIYSASILIFIYLIINIIISLIFSIVLKLPMNGFNVVNGFEHVSFLKILLVGMTTRWIELVVSFIFILLLRLYLNSASYGFMIYVFFYIIYFFPFPYLGYHPIGSSSLSHLQEFNTKAMLNIPIFIVTQFSILLVLYLLLKKRIKSISF